LAGIHRTRFRGARWQAVIRLARYRTACAGNAFARMRNVVKKCDAKRLKGRLLAITLVWTIILVAGVGFGVSAVASEIAISGTKFHLDGKPFPYTGVSFFNAIY